MIYNWQSSHVILTTVGTMVFLLQVCFNAEQHHQNSVHERYHRDQVERSLQAVSEHLQSALKVSTPPPPPVSSCDRS